MSDYERWEQVYGRHPVESLPWEMGEPRPLLVDLIETRKVVPEGKALDIGCGRGTNTIYLAGAGFETTGMDISRTAVAQAKSKAREAGVEILFCVGSVLNLPFADDEFDLVFDWGCFHHIHAPDRERFALGIRRALKDGAHCFVVCFSDKNGSAWNYLSKEDIVTIWSPYLDITSVEHFSSVEADGRVRFFYATLMQCCGES